jgi:hypothetical protein
MESRSGAQSRHTGKHRSDHRCADDDSPAFVCAEKRWGHVPITGRRRGADSGLLHHHVGCWWGLPAAPPRAPRAAAPPRARKITNEAVTPYGAPGDATSGPVLQPPGCARRRPAAPNTLRLLQLRAMRCAPDDGAARRRPCTAWWRSYGRLAAYRGR